MRTCYLASIFSKAFLLATLVAIGGASAPVITENVLHPFGGTPDGALPVAGLVIGAKYGNFFGTTSGGGKGFGIVFELTGKHHKTEKVLYSFSGGSDGAVPVAGLAIDKAGNLYGTTSGGGNNGLGVVFELTKSSNYMHEIVLHSFSGGIDGAVPVAGLVIDSQGNLFGTTSGGGKSGFGIVFVLNGKHQETVLHTFSGGGSDGAVPKAGLIFDKTDNLYGTTSKGGSNGLGVAFELLKNGGYKKEAVLHSFAGASEGADPEAGLAFGPQTNLFGTTSAGGKGFGVVFELTASSGYTKETVLHTFSGGGDGAVPLAGLVFPLSTAEEHADRPPNGGCTYGCGTTVFGGNKKCNAPKGCGVVFSLEEGVTRSGHTQP